MDEKEINEHYHRMLDLLEHYRMKEVMNLLESDLENYENYEIRTKLDSLKTQYASMLKYLKTGVEDVSRGYMYLEIFANLWVLIDQMYQFMLDRKSTDLYHQMRRNMTMAPEDLLKKLRALDNFPDDLAVAELVPGNTSEIDRLTAAHEIVLQEIFRLIWCNSCWNKQEKAWMEEAFASRQMESADRGFLVAAVMMSLLKCFDPLKVSFIFSLCYDADLLVKQRAIVATALIFHFYSEQLQLYADLVQTLLLHDSKGEFIQSLQQVYIQLIRAQYVDQVKTMMRDEIMPNVIQASEINLKSEEDDLSKENIFDMENLDAPNLTNSLREMFDLQNQGADIYIGSFAQLKGFPFFKEIHNWFYPFSMHHSLVNKIQRLNKDGEQDFMAMAVLNASGFCDSDKYSFCFMLQMADPSVSMLSGKTVLSEMMGNDSLEKISLKEPKAEEISNSFIQDLYRFYTIYTHCKEFRNPFGEVIKLHKKPQLVNLLNHEDFLLKVSDVYYYYKDYKSYISIMRDWLELKKVENISVENVESLKKLAFCYEKVKDYSAAYLLLDKLIKLSPNDEWVIHALAVCSRMLGDYSVAEAAYDKLATQYPEKISYCYNKGVCLFSLKNYEEALKCFFKVAYLDASNVKNLRYLVITSLVLGKYQQAENYVQKLLDASMTSENYRLSGHVAWIMKEPEKAIERYRKASDLLNDQEAFNKAMTDDYESLLKDQGIDFTDFVLLKDLFV